MSDGPRFLTLNDVAEVLNTSLAQVSALVQRGEIRALKIGGRGQWRIERDELEAFIQRMYAETEAQIQAQAKAPQAGVSAARAAKGTTST